MMSATFLFSRILVTLLNDLAAICFFWWKIPEQKNQMTAELFTRMWTISDKKPQIIIFSLFNRSRAGIFFIVLIRKFRWWPNLAEFWSKKLLTIILIFRSFWMCFSERVQTNIPNWYFFQISWFEKSDDRGIVHANSDQKKQLTADDNIFVS